MYMGVYHVTVHHTSYDKIMYIYHISIYNNYTQCIDLYV